MGKILSVKIKKAKGCNHEYKNSVNLEDYKQLALILSDLQLHGGNVKKAFEEFHDLTTKSFPW